MEAHADSFGLLAELAIALAGFAGVSAAFAGRSRSYEFLERTRLLALFVNSGAMLAGCGVAHSLLLAGAPPDTTFRIASLATAMVLTAFGLPAVLRVYRAAQAPDSTVESWAVHLTTGYLLLSMLVLAANVWMGTAHLLVGTLWILLVYGLWMFSRLLTLSD